MKSQSASLKTFPLYLLVCAIVFLFAWPLLSWTTFSEDDTHLLRVAISSTWYEPYFRPDVYQQLSAANFTPLSFSFYQLILHFFSVSSQYFLLATLLSMAVFTAMAGLLSHRISGSELAPWLVMTLIVSSLTVPTLVSRFYTIHYILGGIFAFTSLWIFLKKDNSTLVRFFGALILLFALLSKEVYIFVPAIIFLLGIYRKDWKLGAITVAVTVIYLVWRTSMLGLPTAADSTSRYMTFFWNVDADTWFSFFVWYLKSRLFIVSAVLLGLMLNPAKMVFLPLAFLFLLPVLAASHGFEQPELHGDRLFLAFDSTLALVSGIALATSDKVKKTARNYSVAILFCLVVIAQIVNVSGIRARQEQAIDYKITNYLVHNYTDLNNKVIYTPMAFSQGDIQYAFNTLGISTLEITHNCLAALEFESERVVVFNPGGEISSADELASVCQRASPNIVINTPPQLNGNVIQWSIDVEDGYIGGVYFVDRNLPVQVTEFSQVLAIPNDNERVQIFATRGNQWWFSEIMPLKSVN